ncbi:MAG TPA: LysR family transcriptional regulator [Candidatus Eremiobacteraceae bacterium]|nr:LysR family transcriptional regulator [Candidatus Eremiobacteraceae bacterium]
MIAAVARSGGVTAAAQTLRISQPAVTAQLRAAERTLGQRLFVRTRSGLIPTPAGRAAAAYAQRSEALRKALMASMAESAAATGGVLRCGASPTLAEFRLPAVLAALRRSHPSAHVDVALGNSSELLGQLESGALDVAVVGAHRRSKRLRYREIGSDRIVAVAAPSSRYSRGNISPRSLTDVAFVVREAGSATRECGLACLARAGVRPARTMPLGTNESVARMVAAGLGIGILSLDAVRRHVERGELAIVRVAGWKCVRRLYVARRAGVANPLVDAFWSAAAP